MSNRVWRRLGTLSLIGGAICFQSATGMAGDDVSYPFPGMTLRTNSAECISKYQDLYTLMGTYMNGVPAVDTVKRLDVLFGGITSESPFTPISSGEFRTDLYSVVSTYADPSGGSFKGQQAISADWQDPTQNKVNNEMALTMTGGASVRINAKYSSCAADALASYLSVFMTKGSYTPGSVSCYATFNFSKAVGQNSPSSVCSDLTKSLQDIVTAALSSYQSTTLPKLRLNSNSGAPVEDEDLDAAINDNSITSLEFDSTFWNLMGSYGQALDASCYPVWNGMSYPDWNDYKARKQYNVAQYRGFKQAWIEKGVMLASISSLVTSNNVAIICNKIAASSQ